MQNYPKKVYVHCRFCCYFSKRKQTYYINPYPILRFTNERKTVVLPSKITTFISMPDVTILTSYPLPISFHLCHTIYTGFHSPKQGNTPQQNSQWEAQFLNRSLLYTCITNTNIWLCRCRTKPEKGLEWYTNWRWF